MKRLDNLFAYLSLLGVAATVVLAVVAVVTLFVKGAGTPPPPPPPPPTSMIASEAGTSEAGTAGADAAQPSAAATVTAGAPAPDSHGTTISLAEGEKAFRKCKACHSLATDGKNKVGPNLWGIVRQQVASVEGFGYSDALSALSGETWSVERLDAYLENPKAAIPGNRMAFPGIKSAEQRSSLIAYLAANADTPIPAAELGFAAAGAGAAAAVGEGEVTDAAAVFADPPPPSPERLAEIAEKVAALEAELGSLDYERARFHRLHFQPEIAMASNQECLVCHQEILDHKPLEQSPVGVAASDVLAWYQTLDTYSGDQASFHYRHLESPLAKTVMNLDCVFCHQGNDPREETPDMMPGRAASTTPATPEFTLRKQINPSTTCLRCHGAMPDPVEIMGLGGPWHEVRGDMEDEETPNGCLTCHEDLFRTVRHGVTYLNAASIEEAAKSSSDLCYGCHGGRAWYRISYPYPRSHWPDMDPEVPEWAVDRPTQSEEAYRIAPADAQ